MKILVVSPSYPPRIGGGEKYAHRTNAELVRNGVSVHVVTSVIGLTGSQTVDGVEVEFVRAWRFVGFPWFNPWKLLVRMRATQATLILSYGPSPYDPITAFLSKLLHLSFIQIYHADFNERRMVTRIVTWLHNRMALALAETIVCTNDSMRSRLARRGFRQKIVMTFPGVDQVFFLSPEKSRDLDVLFVGALDRDHSYKRLDLLIEALAVIRLTAEIHLTVVGDGDMRAEFESLAEELDLALSVSFLGKVDDTELGDLYARSKVMVLPSPSTQEGFGLVCLEAMASGLPVVCSKNAGASAIVQEAPGCGTWDGVNVGSLAGKILSTRAASPQVRANLRKYAEQFSWRASVGDLLAQLRQHCACGKTT